MDQVIQAVERIRRHPLANIDQGFRQVSQDSLRLELKQDIDELYGWIAPHHLPNDYQFFLEFYGGLGIHTASYSFQVRGTGPMRNGWYLHIIGTPGEFDEGLYVNGLLEISTLSIIQRDSGVGASFFLDLGGMISFGCVISISNRELTEKIDSPEIILRNPNLYTESWTKIANTFTDWLDLAAETWGTFGYLKNA